MGCGSSVPVQSPGEKPDNPRATPAASQTSPTPAGQSAPPAVPKSGSVSSDLAGSSSSPTPGGTRTPVGAAFAAGSSGASKDKDSHPNVASLAELPSAIALAAAFNDVAYFKSTFALIAAKHARQSSAGGSTTLVPGASAGTRLPAAHPPALSGMPRIRQLSRGDSVGSDASDAPPHAAAAAATDSHEAVADCGGNAIGAPPPIRVPASSDGEGHAAIAAAAPPLLPTHSGAAAAVAAPAPSAAAGSAVTHPTSHAAPAAPSHHRELSVVT
jgi:hypothetical protein